MSSKRVFRTVGLVALCLLVGVGLSRALGGAQVGIPLPPPPPELMLLGYPGFEQLAAAIRGIPNIERARSLDDPPFITLTPVKECGTPIAGIYINTEPRVAAARSYDDGPILIGAVRSLDDGSSLLSRGEGVPLPKGDYYIWMSNLRALLLATKIPAETITAIPLPFEPDDGFTALVTISADGKVDIKAILYYRDKVFRKPEEWLRIIGSLISLKDKGCDLTVRHLSVRATKISPPCPPCTVPPCLPCPPAQWEITAIAIITNIGQIDVKEPFTVRFLLNLTPIPPEEWLGELAAGASQTVVATATVDKPGLYIVTVIVDPENRIKERNETNNIAQRAVNAQG